MTATRLPVVVPAIPPKGPPLSLLGSALRPDKTTDPDGQDLTTADLSGLPADLRAEIQARKGEAWTRGITYAPENHWAAELRDPCDTTSADLPSLPAPYELALHEVAGGTLAAHKYEYQVTAKNANGETTARAAVAITTTGEGSVKLTWTKVDETATYGIYGRLEGEIKHLATVGPFDDDQAAEWVDTGEKTPTGSGPPSSNTTGGKGTYTNLPIVTAIPYQIETEDYCSTFGFDKRDFKGRAERLLSNASPQAMGKEFWTGTLAKAKELPNSYLAKEGLAEILEGKPSVERGFEALQNALQQCGFGGQGMIHLQAQTAPNLLRVRRVGSLLLDMFDNIIVPDVGYPGTAPEGHSTESGCAWMFATDLVACRIEDEATIFTETFAEATDWGQGQDPNSIRMRARKLAIAYFDAACVFAQQVTLPT